MTTDGRRGWADAQRQDEARDWLVGRLAAAGRRVTGPVEARVRPWSLVWRVPTDAGPVWFKANNPGTVHEAGLLAVLAELAPDHLLAPIAVDAARGWSLLPDGGASLRELVGGQPDLDHWEHALTAYAALQRAVAQRVEGLLALGVPDHRPERLPALLSDLLDDWESLRIGADGGLSTETYDRLRAELPAYADRCRRLAEIGVPATIQHDDLHDGNIFATPAGGYRFFDWGDASVAHPFGTLLVTLRSIRYASEREPGGPALTRLRDAYLEPWTDAYDRATLVEAARLAVNVTTVSRALSWRRSLDTAGPARAEYAEAVPGWLAELLTPDEV